MGITRKPRIMSKTIKNVLIQHMPANCADFHIEEVGKMPEGEWFAPTNNVLTGQQFNICREWADLGLMCKRVTPVWKNGSYAGTIIEFLFKPDLSY